MYAFTILKLNVVVKLGEKSKRICWINHQTYLFDTASRTINPEKKCSVPIPSTHMAGSQKSDFLCRQQWFYLLEIFEIVIIIKGNHLVRSDIYALSGQLFIVCLFN